MIDDGGFRCIVYRSNFATVPSWSFFHYFYLFWGEERDDGWLYHVRGRWGWWFVGHIIFSWCDLEGKKFGKSLLLMSCRIFRRADRMTSFAIVIYFAKKFVFNSENSVISFANHLDGSCGMSSSYRWMVPTSWTKSWCSWICWLLAFGVTSLIRLQ